MSNLSQFFALGGNKIKKIQTVTAQQTQQTLGGVVVDYVWTGVTASISAVDTSKTLLICSPSANGIYFYFEAGAAGYSNTGHGAYLQSSTQVRFYGPSIRILGSGLNPNTYPAYMVVQVVEFE